MAEPANTLMLQRVVELLTDHFSTVPWSRDEQDRFLEMAIGEGIVAPYVDAGAASVGDRTALTRIIVVLLKHLGLAWVKDGDSVVVTDAGLELVLTDPPSAVIGRQVAKIQFPNPTLDETDYGPLFNDLLPHLFLLQVLQQTGYRVTDDEYAIFVNLAQSHGDLTEVVQYIAAWRELSDAQRAALRRQLQETRRWTTVANDRAYSIGLYAYPAYLGHVDGVINALNPEDVDTVFADLGEPKAVAFKDAEDWFAYLGDPSQRPDWFTYLSREVERAPTPAAAVDIVEQHAGQLTDEQKEAVARLQREKEVEDFYSERLDLLEPGLTLVADGRQYTTPIGIMDLLCQDATGTYVVVEIKADEAKDSVFGQILRYIGWTHLNLAGGANNVRGIILAGEFPETARYSRIGLLRPDHEQFIRFKKHQLAAQTV